MKFLLLIALTASFLFAQLDTTFVELKGFEDSIGTSHIYYSTKSSKMVLYDSDRKLYVDSTIYKYQILNTNNSIISSVEKGYTLNYFSEDFTPSTLIDDIEFIENDPNRFLYIRNSMGIDPDGSIYKYDGNHKLIFGLLGWFEDIYISSMNYNRLYTVYGNWIAISVDHGNTWSKDYKMNSDGDYFHFLTFSPFDESIIYGVDLDNILIKSVDTGKTFIEVSDLGGWNKDSKLLFDRDGKHIYAVSNNYVYEDNNYYIDNYFIASTDSGNIESWLELFITDKRLNICIDDSIEGNLFLAKGNEILESKDYGKNFTSMLTLDHHASGLYKKPKGELFILTTSQLSKFENDSLINLHTFPVDKSLRFFPIAVGNKWFYHDVGVTYDIQPNPINEYYTIEISKDTLDWAGNHLFLIEGDLRNRRYWIRIDSLEGKIYSKNYFNGSGEKLLYDLAASTGDESISFDGIIKEVFTSIIQLWNEYRYSRIFNLQSLLTPQLTFAQGIGIVNKQHAFDTGHATTTLLGCLINGKLYGDTTTVGSITESAPIIHNYSLSQNYPNPFNPTTTIKYTIPKNYLDEESNVKLIVYDILGKEVATLVSEKKKSGKYQTVFNASNLSSGIYYYSLSYNNNIIVNKMILLK